MLENEKGLENIVLVDNTPEIPEVKTEAAPVSNTEQPSVGLEDLAKRYGWNPEGEKSAAEFIEFALRETPERGKELKRIKRTVEDLKHHMQKSEEYIYKQAMRDLEERQHYAAQAGDQRLVNEIEQEKAQLQPVAQLPPVIEDFIDRNADWYNSPVYEHRKMKEWLLKEDNFLAQYNLPPEEHIKELEASLHKEFANYFKSSQEQVPTRDVVESGHSNVAAPSTSKKRTPTFDQLPQEHKEIARNFEKMGIMTKEEYIKDLIKHGEI